MQVIMGIEDGEYLQILKERERELKQLRGDIKLGNKKFDHIEYDETFLKVYELRYLHAVKEDGASDDILSVILSLRINERN